MSDHSLAAAVGTRERGGGRAGEGFVGHRVQPGRSARVGAACSAEGSLRVRRPRNRERICAAQHACRDRTRGVPSPRAGRRVSAHAEHRVLRETERDAGRHRADGSGGPAVVRRRDRARPCGGSGGHSIRAVDGLDRLDGARRRRGGRTAVVPALHVARPTHVVRAGRAGAQVGLRNADRHGRHARSPRTASTTNATASPCRCGSAEPTRSTWRVIRGGS